MTFTTRLHARPSAVVTSAPLGLHRFELGGMRENYYYVPPGYDVAHPAPMMLLLHGAGGHAHQGLDLVRHLADETGTILVAPASTAQTWDVIIRYAHGPDAAFINRSLQFIFRRYAVDPAHLAICGFSDGASYALTLGLANGDLFSHVIAFSPGFVAPLTPQGQPKIFISHGTQDDILPIQPCSRRIVSQLRRMEYAVMYDEFEGGHTIPPEVVQFAVNWLLDWID